MRILPVLDILGGQVVRGVGGRRDEYRPIVSKLTRSTMPLDVARAFREHFGLGELYVADLDAIMGQPPALAVLQRLREDGFDMWVDAGLRYAAQADSLRRAGATTIVAGLETLEGPHELELLCSNIGGEGIVFSLDLQDGKLLARPGAWPSDDPSKIADCAVAVGVINLLVLDLKRVGSGKGIGTEELCGRLAKRHPHVHLAAGGGIREITDMRRLEGYGVQTVLTASALHDGKIGIADSNALASVEA